MSPRQCLIQLLSICLLATPALGQLPIPAPVCPAVPADVEPRRSLFVTDLEILQHFELEQVMNQLARQSRGASGGTPRIRRAPESARDPTVTIRSIRPATKH